MWVLLALFCDVANQNQCQPSTPPFVFNSEEICEKFLTENLPTIDFNRVTLQYRCVEFGEPA